MEIDLDLTLYVADKVTDFLANSMKKPLERCMVARLISMLYEETLNFSLDPEF